MTKEEKLIEYTNYLSYLYKRMIEAKSESKKEAIMESYLGAVKEFQCLCEEYYHEGLTVADYFRKVNERKEEQDEEIHQRIS